MNDEFINSILALESARELAEVKAPASLDQRVSELLRQEKVSSLTAEEKAELDSYMELEHIMRLIKAQARADLDPELNA